MSAEEQIMLLADYIVLNIPGGLSSNEGVGEYASRLLNDYRDALAAIMLELGVPHEFYPASVANAYEIAKRAITP